DALEGMSPTVLECQARPGDQVDECSRHEHLATLGQRGNPLTDIDRDTADVAGTELDFAGMHACSYPEAEVGDGVPDRAGASDGAGRAVEGGEGTVAHHLHLVTAVPGQLATNGQVVVLKHLAPS